MAELVPYPLESLVTRMFHELDVRDAIFDLPRRSFHLGDPAHDTSVRLHGRRAATPLGPAAGPQSQMAQNIVLSWLGGSRIMELKTVQVNDRLQIPRPCIDMQTVGYNVEWSQELRIPESLEEYAKGSMLVEMLAASGALGLAEGTTDTLYDMSVGYDLAGIRSDAVRGFIEGMKDATSIIDRLRREIPTAHRALRELPFTTRLSDTLTLSTFHGCPPDEIERIIEFLLKEMGLHCIVKLNPMLLGPKETRALLHDALGYTELTVPDSAFTRDTTWQQAVDFVGRLSDVARSVGRGFGVKFTNTLIVQNHRNFFPSSEREMYLSGLPLHVLAMHLVARFRECFTDDHPVSFSAGIDRKNFADAVALGLTPVTVCSDLLKPGGYGRSRGYLDELGRRMDGVGAGSVPEFTLLAFGEAEAALHELKLDALDPKLQACTRALQTGADLASAAGPALFARWVSRARVRNTRAYVGRLAKDVRYHAASNRKVPRKIGSALELFDCITCDKCIPVCPNDANFSLPVPPGEIPVRKLLRTGSEWTESREGTLTLDRKHQIATFADFCNECGNCDVFCPEDGGPYVVKPRFFRRLEDWRRWTEHDGFHVATDRVRNQVTVHARCSGREFTWQRRDGSESYRGAGFEVIVERAASPVVTQADVDEIDLTWLDVIRIVTDAVLSSAVPNYVNAEATARP